MFPVYTPWGGENYVNFFECNISNGDIPFSQETATIFTAPENSAPLLMFYKICKRVRLSLYKREHEMRTRQRLWFFGALSCFLVWKKVFRHTVCLTACCWSDYALYSTADIHDVLLWQLHLTFLSFWIRWSLLRLPSLQR